MGALPAAVGGGFGSAAGGHVVVVLAAIAVVLALAEAVAAVSGVITAVLFRLYDARLLARVMDCTLAVPALELFEDPVLAAKTDRAVRIPGFGPGELVMGVLMKGSVRAEGVAATILVATIWPAAAIPLAVVWIAVGHRLQVNYESDPNFGTDPSSWTEPLRRAKYLKQIGLLPTWAKELRIFGLVGWLGDRFGRQSAIVLRERLQPGLDRRSQVLLHRLAVQPQAVRDLALRAAASQWTKTSVTLSTSKLLLATPAPVSSPDREQPSICEDHTSGDTHVVPLRNYVSAPGELRERQAPQTGELTERRLSVAATDETPTPFVDKLADPDPPKQCR